MALQFPEGRYPNPKEARELLRACDGNREHIKQWNAYRQKNRDWQPDVSHTGGLSDLCGLNLCYYGDDSGDGGWINLAVVNLGMVNLKEANLGGANLAGANLLRANLESAILQGSILDSANLQGANLEETDFKSSYFRQTTLTTVNLGQARNLDTVHLIGPSPIGTDTLELSRGRIPEAFLRGCGLKPWEILGARLYDPDLTASEINDIQYKIFDARTSGPLILGGVFISYSHADAEFVDKVRGKLEDKGVSVWLDKHELVPGPLQKQIDRAIGMNNAVLLVLSKDSIASDWVEHEVNAARRIERKEGRDVLCPVALDDAWEEKQHDIEWEHLTKKNILDFSKWKTKAFDGQFAKLLKGLKIYYTRDDQKDSEGSS